MADKSSKVRKSFMGKRLGRFVGGKNNASSTNPPSAPSSSFTASAACFSNIPAASKAVAQQKTSAPAAQAKTASTQRKAATLKSAAQSTPGTPSSAARITKKIRVRSTNNSSSRRSATATTEPTARAIQKEQNQHQRLQKQRSLTEVTSSAKPPIQKQHSQKDLTTNIKSSKKQHQQQAELVSTPTPKESAAPNSTSATGMRQRLQELQAMIAAGKDEMEQLKAAECVKIQAVVRGVLQRRRYQNLKQQQQKTAPKTSKTNCRKPCASTTKVKKSTITNQNQNNHIALKRKKKKAKKADSGPSVTKPALCKGTAPPTLSAADLEKRKTSAATKIQAVFRVYCKRQRIKTLAPKTAKQKKEKKMESQPGVETVANNQSAETGEAVLKPDRYAWEGGVDGDEDCYAWNEGDSRIDKGKDKDKAAATYKAMTETRKGKPPKSDSSTPTHFRRQSLTKEQANAIKDGSKQKGKTRRMSRLKSKENSQAKSEMKEYSWKDHCMRDQSMEDRSAVPQLTSGKNSKDYNQTKKDKRIKHHSMPFHELFADNKGSSGNLTKPDFNQDVIVEEDVFEDPDHGKDILESSAHTSKRSSIASSLVSRLTELEDETTEDGSLTSKEFSDALSVQQGHDFSEDKLETDLLDLSVMATAPTKHMPLELTETGLRHFGFQQKQRSRRDHSHKDTSVGVMALVNGDGTDTDDGFSVDDRLAPYAYGDNSASQKRRQQPEDTTSDSVMAVVEVSDLKVEPDFELEDYDTEYDEEDYEDDEGDLEDKFSDTVMAVADDYDFDSDDEYLNASVASNEREDDLSITSSEPDVGRQQPSDHRRCPQREVDDGEEEIVDTEVSVMSTATNKRHGKNGGLQKLDGTKCERKKSTLSKPKPFNQFLLPQYASDSSEEESYLHRKRRKWRSRRSMTKGNKPCQPHNHVFNPEDEEELQRSLAEVNTLIEGSQKEIEELMEVECIKIQSFLRMHQKRKKMDSSGCNVSDLKLALSRVGTKDMNAAATAIQCLARGILARSPVEVQRRSRKRSRRNRKHRRAQELERKANEQEAQLRERLADLDLELKRCKQAQEEQKAITLQAMIRGCLVRSKDFLNAETIAAVKIQRIARAAIRVAHLHKILAAIPQQKEEQLQEILDKKKKTIDEFEPGKFDDVGTRVKMVNFLKKQIEKEHETTEKWVTKIKAVKENNVRLMTSNSANVCTVERLRMDVQTKEDKRDTMMKLSQQWIDGIKEYQNRVQLVSHNTKMQQWQIQCCKKYSSLIVDTLDKRYPVKKLVKEVRKFLSEHSEAS